MSFNTLSIAKKLGLGFGAVLVLTMGIGFFGVQKLQQIRATGAEIENSWLPSVRYIAEVNNFASRYRANVYQHLMSNEPAEKTTLDEAMKGLLGKLEESKAKYEKFLSSDSERKLYSEFNVAWSSYLSAASKALDLSRKNKREEAFEVLMNSAKKEFLVANAKIEELVQVSNQGAENAGHTADSLYHVAFKMLLVCIFAALLIGFFFAYWIARGITGPLNKVMQSLDSGASNILAASNQLSVGSQQLSQVSTEQASSIEESSASLEQISGMIENNVRNAEASAELAEQVKGKAEDGNRSMQSVTESMQQILESNKRIERLVKVIEEIGEKTALIDEIVFQTKLLSFNASVEAERAGEHGRGFAVVAQEVGNLAQMSGKSALEITNIVKTSIKDAQDIATENRSRVENGANLVKDTAGILRQMGTSCENVATSARQILSASQEQLTGIRQISTAIETLNQATQQTAANAEESASASEELTSQAQGLNGIVTELTEVVHGAGAAQHETRNQMNFGASIGTVPHIPAVKSFKAAKAARESKLSSVDTRATGRKVANGTSFPNGVPSADGTDAWEKL